MSRASRPGRRASRALGGWLCRGGALLALLWACDDGDGGAGRPRTPPSSGDALVSGGATSGEAGPRDALLVGDAVPRDAAPPPPDACVPACRGAECGDDGCGGSCGPCGDGERCAGGICVVEGCAGGLTRCAGGCVDTATDVAHCGGCADPCLRPAGARVRCEDAGCVYVCLAEDGAPEVVDPLSDRRHCGDCGTACEGECYRATCVIAGCQMVLEAIIACLVESPDCAAIDADDAERLAAEGQEICEAPGLFGLVERVTAAEDCPGIIELVGDVWCSGG